jgi:hypothetical protein
MVEQKKVLVVSFTDLERDPRVNRQLRFLRDYYQVVAAGAASPKLDEVDFVQLQPRLTTRFQKHLNPVQLLTRRYESYYWTRPYVVDGLHKLADVNADVILANDIDSLPLALRLSNGRPVVYDAHEYAPLEFSDSFKFRMMYQGYKTYLCKRYIPFVAEMLTVCDGIAQQYFRDNGIVPSVMYNAALYEPLRPEISTDPNKIRLIHHGGAMPTRQLELMIDTMKLLDERFELHFMLVECNPKYMRSLERRAEKTGRVFFHPTVPMTAIARETNKYDMGIYLLRPNNFNNKHSLPNKFFEFIQARLGMAIGPSPEMSKIVKQNDLGVVADKFTPRALADQLNRLTHEDVIQFKHNAHAVSKQFSSEGTRQILLDSVERALYPKKSSQNAINRVIGQQSQSANGEYERT